MFVYIIYIYRCLLTYTGLLIWLGLMPFLCLSVVEDSQFVCSWLAWLLELHTWISSRLQTLTSPRFSCRSLWLQRYGNNFVRIGELWWCLGTRFCHHTIDFQNLENLVNDLGQGKQTHLVQATQCTGYIYMSTYYCYINYYFENCNSDTEGTFFLDKRVRAFPHYQFIRWSICSRFVCLIYPKP